MNIDSILEKLHIESLNKMQLDVAKAMSTTADDVVILSPTGSGKTFGVSLAACFQTQHNRGFSSGGSYCSE